MSSHFQFKQFLVDQKESAMKVGTDGVLLGAWCTVFDAEEILDIGTGTGVISLMLAQRTGATNITAVEIDGGACNDARKNFYNSPWNSRLQLVHTDIRNFVADRKFDLIVSNPPFFSDSLIPSETSKATARHMQNLQLEDILNWKRFLSPNGRIAVVYPTKTASKLCEMVVDSGLYIHRMCAVKPTPYKLPHRLMLEFGQKSQTVQNTEITIEDGGRHEYSKDYKSLTQSFYLKF